MDKKIFLDKNDIIELTGIEFYQLDYLVKTGKVPAIKRGSGRKRLYPHRAIEIIKNWQNKGKIHNDKR